LQSINQSIALPILTEKKVSLVIKRDDTLHLHISGNKYRKLKYNIARAKKEKHQTLLTFGGAFSNHIAATAAAGKIYGFKTIGVIRGLEIAEKWKQNPTLQFAFEQGMRFKFISRTDYRDKEKDAFQEKLRTEFGLFFRIPEGGTNADAIRGCEEILTDEDMKFDTVCCAVGTGGTLAGISNSAANHQQVIGYPALKGDFLREDIRKFAKKENWSLVTDYHFGGYGKVSENLIHFINTFKEKTKIPLDPIYTGKMVFGILEMIKKDHFCPQTKILMIHSGGLQGIAGMNTMLKKKNLPLLTI